MDDQTKMKHKEEMRKKMEELFKPKTEPPSYMG
jgi:hypothetical protein